VVERASELAPSKASSLLSVDGLIKLRIQRVFIGALCRQMSSCNQSERDAILGRDSYERKLNNHHDQGRRQGATAIIELFSVTHTSKKIRRGQGAPVRRRGAPVPPFDVPLCHCATMAQWPVQAWSDFGPVATGRLIDAEVRVLFIYLVFECIFE